MLIFISGLATVFCLPLDSDSDSDSTYKNDSRLVRRRVAEFAKTTKFVIV